MRIHPLLAPLLVIAVLSVAGMAIWSQNSFLSQSAPVSASFVKAHGGSKTVSKTAAGKKKKQKSKLESPMAPTPNPTKAGGGGGGLGSTASIPACVLPNGECDINPPHRDTTYVCCSGLQCVKFDGGDPKKGGKCEQIKPKPDPEGCPGVDEKCSEGTCCSGLKCNHQLPNPKSWVCQLDCVGLGTSCDVGGGNTCCGRFYCDPSAVDPTKGFCKLRSKR